ncbi:hypothetical protein E5F05_08890 [Deinococcus metallilatus]|uniref:Uncharacterized protein n=1 Tax=Deinococcus metallilatus TaxID=1211322 RepID=A0AAJ5JYG0_9DEIO|nr:hypothetical protein [Deinococcus metallilatus]MBB5295423.1 hypothetical protein [Deinococcus metallilatus]QBY08052.1 hypothetical protein E5F05_08890 [Deinococcus metallilatus]RXJ12945.1 hypothetical protein ERJ73_07715 [Deinococcus metallilatus]TLK27133.1 hypothetical protein FCS05_09600 [Deinococcus metallilatus]GMA16100.1 hypothetical protein GCM10025871_24310 [Deinococcus metallilatus]
MPPTERPFLTPPNPDGEAPGGAVPTALFDLAVNRADAALRGLRPADPTQALAAWHARTRFARRVPLAAVAAALAQKPGEGGEWHWAGGPGGGWVGGKAPFP